MRRVTCLILILAVLALVAGRALSDRNGETVSGTRAFAIDGRRFMVEDPAGDSFSLVERELAKRGIDTLRSSENLASVLDSRSVEQLREAPAEKGASPLPRGLEQEHVLRLETATGPVDIAFGRVVCAEKDIIGRLRSSGWECVESGTHGAPGAVAQLTKGKETSFVFLEKDERRFLAIRRPVR